MFEVHNVRIDLSGLEGMFNPENLSDALKALAADVAVDCQEHVPMETGTLRGSRQVATDGSKVSWEAPYAIYVYNMEGVNWTTPNTSGDWFEVASREHLRDWTETVKKQLLKGA